MFSSISRSLFKKAVNTNRLTYTALRGIKLHEYQAAKLLQSFDVPVPYVSFLENGKTLIISQYRAMLHLLLKRPKMSEFNLKKTADQDTL